MKVASNMAKLVSNADVVRRNLRMHMQRKITSARLGNLLSKTEWCNESCVNTCWLRNSASDMKVVFNMCWRRTWRRLCLTLPWREEFANRGPLAKKLSRGRMRNKEQEPDNAQSLAGLRQKSDRRKTVHSIPPGVVKLHPMLSEPDPESGWNSKKA